MPTRQTTVAPGRSLITSASISAGHTYLATCAGHLRSGSDGSTGTIATTALRRSPWSRSLDQRPLTSTRRRYHNVFPVQRLYFMGICRPRHVSTFEPP